MEYRPGRFNYSCRYCLEKPYFKCRKKERIIEHVKSCSKSFNNLKQNTDYVVCRICNLHAKTLGQHIVTQHKISIKEYKEKYGQCISEKCSKTYSKLNNGKGAFETWKKRQIAAGNNIEELMKIKNKRASEAMMANTELRQKRAANMKKLVTEFLKDDNYRKNLSDRAKITSSRPDIIEKRSAQLKKWRDENPEKALKSLEKMLKTYQSKPEKLLLNFLKKMKGFNFKNNKFLHDQSFNNKTNRKQLDIVDLSKKIIVEYDGEIHFNDYFKNGKLEHIQSMDKALDEYALKNDYLLIRVCYDQFTDRQNIKNCRFRFGALKSLVKIIKENKPGVYKIGEVYEQHKVN